MARVDGKNVIIPQQIRDVAQTFTDLQEDRHRADYNYTARFTRAEVREKVKEVQDAFKQWAAVRKTPEADFYLIALLTGNRRRD